MKSARVFWSAPQTSIKFKKEIVIYILATQIFVRRVLLVSYEYLFPVDVFVKTTCKVSVFDFMAWINSVYICEQSLNTKSLYEFQFHQIWYLIHYLKNIQSNCKIFSSDTPQYVQQKMFRFLWPMNGKSKSIPYEWNIYICSDCWTSTGSNSATAYTSFRINPYTGHKAEAITYSSTSDECIYALVRTKPNGL